MKILYIGPASGTSLDRANAIKRLGHDVSIIDPFSFLPNSPWVARIIWHAAPEIFTPLVRKKILQKIKGHTFDLTLVDSGELISRKTINSLKKFSKRVINYNIDDPYGYRDGCRFRVMRNSIPAYDLVVVVRDINIPEAKALGAKKVLCVYRAADEITHSPRMLTDSDWEKWQSEALFVGTWMPERGPFFVTLIKRGVPLSIYGSNWHKDPQWETIKPFWKGPHLNGDDYAKAIQCSKLCIGVLSKENRDLHTTRSLEIPALGGLFCAERTSEHLCLYEEGKEAEFWGSSDECVGKIHELLNDNIKANSIRQNGHLRAKRNPWWNEKVANMIIDASFN